MTTVTLKRPVEHDGKTFTTIEVDEPTVGAIEAHEAARAAGKGETAALVAMLAVDTEWPEAALRKVRASDLAAIGEAMAPFVEAPAAGATGEPSSPTSPMS